MLWHILYSQCYGHENRKIPGAHWQASLASLMSSKPELEVLCQKRLVAFLRMTPKVLVLHPPQVHRHMYKCTCTNRYELLTSFSIYNGMCFLYFFIWLLILNMFCCLLSLSTFNSARISNLAHLVLGCVSYIFLCCAFLSATSSSLDCEINPMERLHFLGFFQIELPLYWRKYSRLICQIKINICIHSDMKSHSSNWVTIHLFFSMSCDISVSSVMKSLLYNCEVSDN